MGNTTEIMKLEMKQEYLWTHSKARLQLIRSTAGANLNWLFLPGGPGLGSESLAGLTQIVKLPGSIWHLDLPGDGSNTTSNDWESFSHWSKALLEAATALSNVILVAHSTGGMYALATPELSKVLRGLVLMDSAPDASWQEQFYQVETLAQTFPFLYFRICFNSLGKNSISISLIIAN